MGFNVSGIVINSSYQDRIEELQNDLNITLEPIENVTFEVASSNWTEENSAFVFFDEESTILFLNMELCAEAYPIPKKQVLTFAISETSMAFSLNYSNGKNIERQITEYEGDKISDDGEPFDFEENCNDTSEIIWEKIDELLETPFHSIELSSPVLKYKISLGKPVIKESVETYQEVKTSTEKVELEPDLTISSIKKIKTGCAPVLLLAILMAGSILLYFL